MCVSFHAKLNSPQDLASIWRKTLGVVRVLWISLYLGHISALNSKNLIWISDTKGINSNSFMEVTQARLVPVEHWERLQPSPMLFAQLLSAPCSHWSCLRAIGCKKKRSYINTHVIFSISFFQVHWKGQDFTQETLNDNIWKKPADFVRCSWPRFSSEIPGEVKAS